MAQYVTDPDTGRLTPMPAPAPVARQRGVRWQEHVARPGADTIVGYSRFVRIMKVMLPLIAFSLIVLVVVYSTMGKEGGKVQFVSQDVGKLENDRQLVAPKLTGTDGRGQPFTVTAKAATQAPGKARKMAIEEVVADVTMQDKSWVQVSAPLGELDVEGKTLDLSKTINIFSDKGYECHTDSARYDFGAGLLKGDHPISCQGPLGLIQAQRFEGLREPGVMRFLGGVSTTYFPAAREGVAKEAAETNPEGIAEPVADDATGEAAAVTPGATAPAATTPTSVPPTAPKTIQPKAKPATP
jgi:lipopolysaccharide export system protein LptC